MAINKGEQKGGLFGYYCLSSDVSDLDERAEEDKCWSGSWAYCIDTGPDTNYEVIITPPNVPNGTWAVSNKTTTGFIFTFE